MRIKITVEYAERQISVRAFDEKNDRQIASGGGADAREAARWLVRNVNKLAAAIEDRLKQLGFVTEEEIEEIVANLNAEINGEGETA